MTSPDFTEARARRALLWTAAGLGLLGAALVLLPPVAGPLLAVVGVLKGSTPSQHWQERLRTLGLDSFVAAGSALLFAVLGVPRWERVLRAIRDRRLWLVVAVLLVLVLWLPRAVYTQGARIAGEHYWWLDDDPMISMRYARNLAAGHGLVWNPGERVEGYSNFLWVLMMAVIHLIGVPPSKAALPVLVIGIAIAVATVPVLIRLVRVLGGGTAATIGVLLAYALNIDLMVWATRGHEMPLVTLVLLWSLCRVIEEARDGTPRLTTALAAGVLGLIRADGAVLALLVMGLGLLLHRDRLRWLAYCCAGLALPAAHLLFRLVYYHDWLPNTAYLKATGWPGRTRAGVRYVLEFGDRYFLLLAGAAAGVALCRNRVSILLAALCVIYAGYVAWVGGDFFPHSRFMAPLLPILAAVAFRGLESIPARISPWVAVGALVLSAGYLAHERVEANAIRVFVPLLAVLLPLGFADVPRAAALAACLAIISAGGPYVPSPDMPIFLPPGGGDRSNVELGLLLKQNTPPETRVADFWAGSVFYFSERYGIDLLGKCDARIARMHVVSAGMLPGHNKWDFAYSLGERRPDYVIAMFHLPTSEAEMSPLARGDMAFTGALYFDPTFREHCLPNPVPLPTRRTIFACDWSPEARRLNAWRPLPP